MRKEYKSKNTEQRRLGNQTKLQIWTQMKAPNQKNEMNMKHHASEKIKKIKTKNFHHTLSILQAKEIKPSLDGLPSLTPQTWISSLQRTTSISTSDNHQHSCLSFLLQPPFASSLRTRSLMQQCTRETMSRDFLSSRWPKCTSQISINFFFLKLIVCE